jgi:hypothetical protein
MAKITLLLTMFALILLIGEAVAPMTGVTAQSPEDSDGGFWESSLSNPDQVQTHLKPNDLLSTAACPLDMISYWKLDETTGSTYEDFVGANDGHCTGNNCPFPEDGILAGGQRLMGNQGIDVPASADFDWDGNGEFSIELWVNIPEVESCDGSVIFVGRHAGVPAWWVGCDHGSNMAVFSARDSTGSGKEISGGPALNDGEWHHVVAIHDGGNDLVQLFVDGQLAAAETKIFTGNWISQKEINIGYYKVIYGPPYYYFSGTLDEIAVYNRALPADEIAYHYANGLGGKGYCEPLELVVHTEGAGSVNTSPIEPYRFGQMVTVTAEPSPGYIFFEWRDDLTGSVNPATITMNGNKTITARFSDPIYYTLLVEENGLGFVSLEPDLDEYLHGSMVTLRAIPQPRWLFSSWGGDLSGNQSPVEIMVTSDLAITANFMEADYLIFLPLIFK